MKVQKETKVASTGVATAAQLEAINAQAKAELTAEQVYVFSVRLCDDQIDRDGERFATEALPELAKLFVGKTGIVDHKWSTSGQVARIFETQVGKRSLTNISVVWLDGITMPVVDSLGDEFLDTVKHGDIVEVKENGVVIIK